MRALLIACALALAVAPAAGAKPDNPPKEKKPKTAAVEHIANLPAPAAVSANFKTYGSGKSKRTYMFLSTLHGLHVYDVTNGAAPERVAVLPFPHFQNEDVSLGGNRLLISTDGGLGGGFLFVIDISDPKLPKPVHAIKMEASGEGHTATCIDAKCRWVWVAGDQLTPGIDVYDLDRASDVDAGAVRADQNPGTSWTDIFGLPPLPASKVSVGTMRRGDYREFGWSTHDVHVDQAGVAWVAGGDGTIGFDVSKYSAAGTDPLRPPIVSRTANNALNDNDSFDGPVFALPDMINGVADAAIDVMNGQVPPDVPEAHAGFDPERSKDTVNDFIHHNALRPDGGDTVLITEEDLYNRRVSNMPGGCEIQGSFQTWRIEGGEMKPLDSWVTEFNELLADQDQDPWGGDIVPTMGLCSSHYFDERDDLVAVGWYEQGVRLLDIEDPTDIKQIGYWMPTGSAVWGAYWSPTAKDVVYVVDNKRGVDVVRVKRRTAQVDAPLLPSWTAGQKSFGRAYPGLGFICRIK